jgi:maltooligosyltrehalose trehalohydrolase
MTVAAELRVWAPRARRVDVVVGEHDGGERTAMSPVGGGWFAVATPAGAAQGYRFSLDGGPPRPDPRSAWQPEGVDGPSALVDDGALGFDPADRWRGVHLPSSVVYELHVGTFSPEGTFDGAIARLDHLVALGVDVVEVMPVAEFPGARGWGYDGVLLWAPHHAYGGPEGFARLVRACHERGLGVLLDVVYNHLGPSGNHLGEFGPYFTDRYRTPWGDAVNVDDAGSDEVRASVIGNACTWLERYHLDGLRLDAVHAITDASARHILEELAARVDALAARLGRPLWLVAESDRNDPRLVRPREAGGYGLAAQWSDDVHHALHAVLTGEHDGYYADFGLPSQLATALERGWVYGRTFSPHRDRSHGEAPGGLPGWRFVVCSQNHDQVGNRALGERLVQLTDVERAKVAAALVLLSPFVPLLFQGEEWAASTPFQYFTDHTDPELAEAVRQGRREEFKAFVQPDDVPDPQDPATAARSTLRWDELDAEPHRGMLAWYRDVLALRRQGCRSLPVEQVRARADDDARWLVVERGDLVLAANLGPAPVRVPVGPHGDVLLASQPPRDEGRELELAAWSVVVLAP